MEFLEIQQKQAQEIKNIQPLLPTSNHIVINKFQEEDIVVTAYQLKTKPPQLCNEDCEFQEVKFKSSYSNSRI